MPWPLERALTGASGKAPDGVVHRIVYTNAGNYMFQCGAVMEEMPVRMGHTDTANQSILLSAVSHRTARKMLTNEPIGCLACLAFDVEDGDVI